MASLARLAYQPLIGRFSLPWRWALYAALALLFAANIVQVGMQVAWVLLGSDGTDFHVFAVAWDRYQDGTLYVRDSWWYIFRWSPIAAPLLIPVAIIGQNLWRLLHVVALVGLPGRRRLIALASFPFWFDVQAGNIMIFLTIAAYWALRGNRWATGAVLVLAILVPRPLMVPLAAWLLWKQPEWRLPFVALFAVHAMAVLATGYADEWATILFSATSQMLGDLNVGPTAVFGLWWMLAAFPLAVWAFWRGYPATAGLLLQPYWLPYYLLMPLADRWPSPRWWRTRVVRHREASAARSGIAQGCGTRAAGMSRSRTS